MSILQSQGEILGVATACLEYLSLGLMSDFNYDYFYYEKESLYSLWAIRPLSIHGRVLQQAP